MVFCLFGDPCKLYARPSFILLVLMDDIEYYLFVGDSRRKCALNEFGWSEIEKDL